MKSRNTSHQELLPLESVEHRIFALRGYRVMLDRDLAELYGVSVKRLNEQVKRNRDRFPSDFMFRLTPTEARVVLLSRSQNATLKRGENMKYAPFVFTEHGAVMFANVLKSKVAVKASIQVVRAFVRLRQMLATHVELARKLEAPERKVGRHDADLEAVLMILKKLLQVPPKGVPGLRWGFPNDACRVAKRRPLQLEDEIVAPRFFASRHNFPAISLPRLSRAYRRRMSKTSDQYNLLAWEVSKDMHL